MENLLREEFTIKETIVKIISDSGEAIDAAKEDIFQRRKEIENYISGNPEFNSSFGPLSVGGSAPEIVKKMASAACLAGVGPMAAVAGAIAESAVRAMMENGAKIAVVENGGDCFAIVDRNFRAGIFAGENKISNKLAFELEKGTEIAFCSSSGKFGHSTSLGKCDLATVFAESGAVADAFATALANRVKGEEDIASALNWIKQAKDVQGALIIKSGKIGLVGELPKIFKNQDQFLLAKITQ
ncbi:MAG: UPF0280 family protein [Candidatus Diapherotrites archaeon]